MFVFDLTHNAICLESPFLATPLSSITPSPLSHPSNLLPPDHLSFLEIVSLCRSETRTWGLAIVYSGEGGVWDPGSSASVHLALNYNSQNAECPGTSSACLLPAQAGDLRVLVWKPGGFAGE